MVGAAARDGQNQRGIERSQTIGDVGERGPVGGELARDRRAGLVDLAQHESRIGHFFVFLGDDDSASSDTKS